MLWNNRYENEKTAGIGQTIEHLLNSGIDGIGDAARYVTHGITHPFQKAWDSGTGKAVADRVGELAGQKWELRHIDPNTTFNISEPINRDNAVLQATDKYTTEHLRDSTQNNIGGGIDLAAAAAGAVGANAIINKVKRVMGR